MVELQSTLFFSIFGVSPREKRRLRMDFCDSSNRHQCLNNVPDHRSATFKDLNDELRARELPGRFSDLNAQCRRAFGVNFEYCRDLSHGVNTLINLINLSMTYLLLSSQNVIDYIVEKSSRILPRV